MAKIVEFRHTLQHDPRPAETSAVVEGELCDKVGLIKLIDEWIVPKMVDEWIKQTQPATEPSGNGDKGEQP